MAEAKKITLEYLIEQALKIPKVKVDREEFLKTTFAKEGILVRQIVEEGPVACDYSDIELDDLAEKLILRRTSESSAMSFAAGIPGGLAIAATIPADTLQFFAMSLRMAQELAYLYGVKDFWTCEGEEGTFVRYLLICSLGAMFGVEGASPATRLLSSHLALRAVGGTPQRATTKEFWEPIIRRISRELTLRLTTDTASKGVAKLIPVIGGFFSGGMTFFAMRPMGQKLYKVLSESAFKYNNSYAMKDYVALEDLCEQEQVDQMFEGQGAVAGEDGWGPMQPNGAPAATDKAPADGNTSIPIGGAAADDSASIPIGGAPAADKDAAIPVSGAADKAPEAKEPAAEGDAKAEEAPKAEEPKAPAAMTMDEVFATIERLAVLREKGAITQEDFDAKKAELLARI
ncbi:MAG: SHOCT domain-containing protein [Lachnospiraceae bacterium]|nr:SHOCT domain-containing protein [Lachnospiraceae bacterium]